MRRSGKRALIQLVLDAETPFDLSGLSSDNISRSNEFSFEITGEVQEGVSGYNEPYGESVAVGQSSWTASIKAFWNHLPTEVNAVLAEMFDAQHKPDRTQDYWDAYRLIIMPDGNRSGFEKWTLSNAVIKNFAPDMPHDDMMALNAQFSGGKWSRERIA